jgi:hypothetical protein
LAACAIHPLPEDVTGVKTAMIVKKIRCEARGAIIDARVKYLQRTYRDVVDLPSMRKRNSQGVSPPIKYNLDYFSLTGIAYSFTLNGTETESASFTANVIKPLAQGTATFTPTAGNSLSRQNIRTFTITDSFGGLIGTKYDEYCDGIGPSYPNVEYPLVGRVGIDEMVTTFIDLARLDALSGTANPYGSAPSSNVPNAMVDSLTFTTTLMAGITPQVAFNPMGQDLQLMNATLPLTASRMDTHGVIIGLGLAGPYTPPGMDPVLRAQTIRRWNSWRAPGFVVGNNPHLIIANPPQSNTGEAVALEAVNNQILRFEVPRSLIVVP